MAVACFEFRHPTLYEPIHQKQISQIVKEFVADDMYNKRNTIITLLIKSGNYENQYLAYLLYDLLSNDSNGTVDTQEQIIFSAIFNQRDMAICI